MDVDHEFPYANDDIVEPNVPFNFPISFDHYRDTIYQNPSLNNINNNNDVEEDLIIDNNTCDYYDTDQFHKLLNAENHVCHVIFNNIRSLPKNFENFKINNLNLIKHKVNIIGLCETKLSTDIEGLYQLEDFSLFTNNNSRMKGGVAIYARSTLNCKLVHDLFTDQRSHVRGSLVK